MLKCRELLSLKMTILSWAIMISGLTAAAQPDAADLAHGKAASASSVENGEHPASRALDGDQDTYWSSTYVDDAWFMVDLGENHTIRRVHLSWEPWAYARAFSIEVSTNGETWSEVYLTTDAAGGEQDIAFEPVAARWVRLTTAKRSSGWGNAIYEFQVFESATPSPEQAATYKAYEAIAEGTRAAMASQGAHGLVYEDLPPLSDKAMQWFNDAKFGMFIHWGLYAILGSGEWTMHHMQTPPEIYAKLADRFDPKDYDPAEWVRIAKDAGMKYMVLTSRHHDGFSLWDSKASIDGFTCMRTPSQRDFIRDYVDACRESGMRVGLYYSLMDWRQPGYFRPREKLDNALAMRRQAQQQVTELVNDYGPLDVLWYDGCWLGHKGDDIQAAWLWQPQVLNTPVRKANPLTVVNDRSGWESDFDTAEGNGKVTGPIKSRSWEKCLNLNNITWGHNTQQFLMSRDDIITMLVDVVVRNGNMLLNVGPDANGVIPPTHVARLREVGAWLDVHGESIYGTRGGPFEPTDVYGSTFKDDTIYLHLQSWPHAGRVTLPPHARVITSAHLLANPELSVRVEQTPQGITLVVPEAGRQTPDTVIVLACGGALASLSTAVGAAAAAAGAVVIHSVTDLSHEFSFYADDRFARQYLSPGVNEDNRNWGTLHKCDLENVNLLVLMAGATPCPYLPEDVSAMRTFMEAGGGIALLGDHDYFRNETVYHQNDLAQVFGATFVDTPAVPPLAAASGTGIDKVFTYDGAKTIELTDGAIWQVLIRDASGQIVAARRHVGRGSLLVASRALFGRQPDAGDPVNAEWVRPLMADLAAGKKVDPDRPTGYAWYDNVVKHGALQLCYSDYLAGEAQAMIDIYEECQPALREFLGVDPSGGMMGSLSLLPTGGGGFSSGANTGLGVWWGGFPEQRYGMVELIGHECTHAWVLPFAEPMWNEPIATYVGACIAAKLGLVEEGRAIIDGRIAGARTLDPDMTRYDLAHGKDVPGAVGWGKAMWIFEQLRKEKPDAIARYFRAKRRWVDREKMDAYTPDDCVAVFSHAMERDMFPWFQSLGLTVDAAKSSVPVYE